MKTIKAEKIRRMSPQERRDYVASISKGRKRDFLKILSSQCKPGEKVCSKCLETLPLKKFYEDKKAPDEHAYWCSRCMSNYRKTPKNNLALRIVKKFLMPNAIRIRTNDQSIVGIYKEKKLVSDLPKVLNNDFKTEIIPHKEFFELKIKP